MIEIDRMFFRLPIIWYVYEWSEVAYFTNGEIEIKKEDCEIEAYFE